MFASWLLIKLPEGTKRGAHVARVLGVGEGTMKAQWIAAAFLVLVGMGGAQAQDYPTRTVTIIVPFAAGGPAGVNGRIVADIFSPPPGQQFVVENVGGGGGTLGALPAAPAAPD